jgi:acetyl esterase/lipase/phospholipase/lecithinase/hemolysin
MRTLLLLAAAVRLFAQAPAPLTPDAAGSFAIWPGAAPGSENWTWREQITGPAGSRMVRNVVAPSLTMYRPKPGAANGASVIIAPGGAFRFLMVDYEGVDIARWLAERGVTAFVLKYRVMHTPEDDAEMTAYVERLMQALRAGDVKSDAPPHYNAATDAALAMAEEDGRQAIRYVRQHAADWGLGAHRIGIVGFSAGGGVVMGPVMQHDANSRPDFAAPVYPAYRSATPVPADAPPLFIAMADDDNVISPNSGARLYMAWHAAGKPAELHIFLRGSHGFGMKVQNLPADNWIHLFYAWMGSSGFVNAPEARITRLYVFGDSYSDGGAGYVDGNGPTAVAYLARRLGFELKPPTDVSVTTDSLNFAVSGARTGSGAGNKIKDALLGRGMMEQVDDFIARVQSRRIVFDPETTLFFLAGGLNDARLPGAETVANLETEIRKLHAAGARRFRVALLPTAIPAFSAVGSRLNPELRRIPDEIKAQLPDARIALSNWGPFFDEVMRNPSRYGIENTTDKCAGRAIFGEDTTPCPTPAVFYYYHSGHPSTAVHKVVGDKLYDEVAGGGENWNDGR